jgi:energy-coupling factor transporter ATP-binding protein EcfA2
MLFRLEIENFYSIRNKQVIDLVAAANAGDKFGHLAPLWPGSEERAPKVVAIFGPNASGKSTVLRSIAFLSWFVQHSFQLGDAQSLGSYYEPFISQSTINEPTRLAVHFAGPREPLAAPGAQTESCRYAYELELLLPVGSPPKVIAETLRFWPKDQGRATTLLSRTEQSVRGSKNFPLGVQGTSIGSIMHPHASVIATLAHLRHQQAIKFRDAAARINYNLLIEKFQISDESLVGYYAKFPAVVESLNKEIQRVDLGLKRLRIEHGTKGPVALFDHDGLSMPVSLNRESHGTRTFLQVFPHIVGALEAGGIAVLDELDLALHPLLLPEIVSRFYDPEQNPHDAQLWFTCQNASLLESLSKEEILFCEKDSKGQTRIFGLNDIKAVRRDDNFYRKYLGGEFGAIPRFG